MCSFTPADLNQHYSWETPEDAALKVKGFPSNKELNRNQGYEVLHFLNRYMEDIGWCTRVSFNNIELLVKVKLPAGRRSHKDVKEWLDLLLRIKR